MKDESIFLIRVVYIYIPLSKYAEGKKASGNFAFIFMASAVHFYRSLLSAAGSIQRWSLLLRTGGPARLRSYPIRVLALRIRNMNAYISRDSKISLWRSTMQKNAKKCKNKIVALGTRASHVLTAHNTNLARTCLTSQNGRDGVRLTLVWPKT